MLPIPRHPENPDYVKWFLPDDKEAYKEFFNEYGFVAVKVLTPEECKESIEDIWDYVESTNYPDRRTKIVRRDWETCGNVNWPGIREEGILAPRLALSKVALERRQNPLVYEVFSELLGTKKLMSNHDRYGLFRPTQDVVLPNGELKHYPKYSTRENLHLDGNPWDEILRPGESQKVKNRLSYQIQSDFITENNILSSSDLNVQGLLNFMDNRIEDGGFQLVPCFAKKMDSWANETLESLGQTYQYQTFVVLPDYLPEFECAERISVPAGCVVVWNQRTPHGSKPNRSNRPRYAQFIRYFPAIDIHSQQGKNRASAMWRFLQQTGFVPSSLGLRLFGLRDYID